MIKAPVALDGISVVVRGHFNAAIFSPLWLLQQELIGASDYSAAEIEVITSEFAVFKTGWLNCQVTPDSLQLNTTDLDEFERLRDVAVGIFNALPHTPVGALGINRQLHFAAKNIDQYHAIGDELVPKKFWESSIALPATRSLTVWGERPDKFGGRVQVQVEPSFRFAHHIYVAHNDHFNLGIREHQPATREEVEAAMKSEEGTPVEPSADKISVVNEILTSVWKSSITRSEDVVNAIASIE